MPASRVGVRVRFKVERANEIAAAQGLTLDHERAAFFGVTQSNYSRVVTGQTAPGQLFIAAALASHPELNFGDLFEVVDA